MKASEFIMTILLLIALLITFCAALGLFIYGIKELRKGEKGTWPLIVYGGFITFSLIVGTIGIILDSMGY